MPIIRSPILGGFSVSRSSNVSNNHAINLYPEIVDDKDGKAVGGLYLHPGLDLFATLGNGPIRGLGNMAGTLIAVSGGGVWTLSGSASSMIGSLGTTAGPVSIIANQTQANIFDGQQGFLIENGALSDLALPFSNPTVGTIIDGFGMVAQGNSNFLWQSNLNDLSTYDALDFATASQKPDYIQSLFAIHDELYVVKQTNTEVWENAGLSGFAFEPISGVHIESGTIAPFSVAKLGETLIWLSQNEQGQGIVVEASGYNLRPISTQALVAQFQSYPTMADAIGYSYQSGGHVFYVIHFPTAKVSWAYDATASALSGIPLWHQIAAFDNGQFGRHWGNAFVEISATVQTVVTEIEAVTYPEGYDTIAFLQGIFLAGGPGGLVTSPDGANWSYTSDAFAQADSLGLGQVLSLASSGSTICAAGGYSPSGSGFTPNFETTTNGTSWTLSSQTVFANPGQVNAITWMGGLFVAVGQNAAGHALIATSPDGLTWTARFTHANVDTVFNCVTAGDSLFVAGGAISGTGNIYTSPDGTTWTQRTSGNLTTVNGVGWNGARFVAVGALSNSNAGIINSTNGTSWSNVSNTSGTTYAHLSVANNVFFVDDFRPSSPNILYSSDGATFTAQGTTLLGENAAVAFGNLNYIVAGCQLSNTGAGGMSSSPNLVNWSVVAQPVKTVETISPASIAAPGLVGDYRNGNVYTLDPNGLTDNGTERKWLRRWRALEKPKDSITTFHSLRIDLETGAAIAPGTIPNIMLRWSDDGGHAYYAERIVPVGALGETAAFAKENRLGSTRRFGSLDRVFEISATADFKVGIVGAQLEVS